MADVDLSVAVSTAGIPAAIAEIERLKAAGQDTSRALAGLSRSGQELGRQLSAGTRSISGTTRTMSEAKTASDQLRQSLHAQGEEYRRLASMNVGATPAERLASAYGSLGAGKSAAAFLRQQQEAFSADPIRDLMAVERQEQALLDARSAKLSAQGNLSRAVWESELAGMDRTQRAQARLTRAQEEYAAARRAVYQANAPRNSDDPVQQAAKIQRQTQATNELASAQRNLTQAQAALNRERDHANDNAFQASYSYFILAGLATQASQAIFGVAEASLTASTAIERSFADVERTFEGTDSQLESLRGRLRELSTSTPSSIIDLSEIATLGNQLGIAATDIENFTAVLAQYTAVSGESAETAATAFGRISNLTGLAASQYSNLASAITYTARTTVATESTIQNTAKEISALAAGAGFSAQSIVGLAGALSSLAIPPERARGALSLYFGALNEAVAEGGPKLQAFSELTNLTADSLQQLVRSNQGQQVFTAFISGLSELDTVAKTTALDTLGLSTIRVDQTMRALAQNVPLVTQSLDGASQAFRENTEIAEQYAIIQATLDSHWREFQNAVQNAAGAVGDAFVPAAKAALVALTNLLTAAAEFARSPIGKVLLTAAGYAALFIGALAAVVGAASLAKASLVILGFAVQGLGWSASMVGLRGWIASLILGDKASRAAAFSTAAFGTAMKGSSAAALVTGMSLNKATVAAKAFGLALGKFAILALAVTAVAAAIADIEKQANRTQYAIDGLGDGVDTLSDAMKADNVSLFKRAMDDANTSTSNADGSVSGLNDSVRSAAQQQIEAEGAIDKTTAAISRQELQVGAATRAWLDAAVQQSDAIQKMIHGAEDTTPIIGGLFSTRSMSNELRAALDAGLDLSAISEAAYTEGTDAAVAIYDGWITELQSKAAGGDKAAQAAIDAMGGVDFKNVLIQPLADGIDAAATEALVAMNLTGTGVTALASDFDEAGNYIGEFSGQVGELFVTFQGVNDQLSEFQDNVQGAIRSYVDFGTVLKTVQDAAQAAADKSGNDDLLTSMVNASTFGDALAQANNDAVTFYDNIISLAEGGNTSFANQLAALGPEAQSILTSALELDSTGQARLEEQARFAAFIASDAFKQALDAEMTNSNQAYALIFQTTGDLQDVRDYIAAQVAGTGEEYERQWAINHPDLLPLNVTPTLSNPTEEQVALWEQQMSGRLTITPIITNVDPGGGGTYSGATQYTDNLTGASVTLPANLDAATLSDSLAIWQENQNLTPEELEAVLNQEGLTDSLDMWIASRGPIKITATIVPTNVGRFYSDPLNKKPYRDGGEIPGFADGGGYGMFRGPGSGISDSILARVSAGEYISTAAATKFWQRNDPSFFDSLNRQMLPTSFMNMLGAAAVSGNRGPERVAHVSITQNNPVTRDPLKQLRESSENVAAGIW